MSHQQDMEDTVEKLIRKGRGILAADESAPTIAKRFAAIGVESTEEKRREYRSLIFSTPSLGDHISGVILYEETLNQRSLDNEPMAGLLLRQGIVAGIKVDKGKGPMANAPGDEITYGLDGLEERLQGYREQGARFAKWRDVYHITDTNPSQLAIEANAEVLARYAAVCQSLGVVPIVEPEVLIDGHHTIGHSAQVSESVLKAVFDALHRHGVVLERMLLKPSMVTPGKSHTTQANPEQVAEATLHVFRRVVPAAVPGIVFLSGGQTPEEATANLNAINQHGPQPWALSFSYGRALQEPAQKAWAGTLENGPAAQSAMHKRAQLNGAARNGEYSNDMEG